MIPNVVKLVTIELILLLLLSLLLGMCQRRRLISSSSVDIKRHEATSPNASIFLKDKLSVNLVAHGVYEVQLGHQEPDELSLHLQILCVCELFLLSERIWLELQLFVRNCWILHLLSLFDLRFLWQL